MKLREILMGQLLTVGSNDLKGNTTYYLKLSYFHFLYYSNMSYEPFETDVSRSLNSGIS